MAWTKEEKDYLKALNEAMQEWEDLGVYSNEIQSIRDELEMFYDDVGKNVKNEHGFSTRVQLTPDQEDTLMDIANAMFNDSHNFLGTYEALQEERGFDSLAETVEFINTAEEFEDDEFYNTIFDSEEYIEIFQYAEDTGYSKAKLEHDIYKLYKNKGLTHSSLTNTIFRMIGDYNKNEKNNW